jgi:tRNA(fMet)-specific endonuclease VapC
MFYLLDTNAVSDYMRGNRNVESRLAALGRADAAVICPIVLGQILFGIERMPTGKYRAELERMASKVLPALSCLPVPESAADQYSKTKLACQRKGVALDENDLWIAATALALNARLVTRDKDFANVGGLVVEDWSV